MWTEELVSGGSDSFPRFLLLAWFGSFKSINKHIPGLIMDLSQSKYQEIWENKAMNKQEESTDGCDAKKMVGFSVLQQSFCFSLKPANVTFLLYKTHWLIAWPTKLLYWPRISFNLLERGICNSTTRKITQFSRRLPSRVLSIFFLSSRTWKHVCI